MRFNTESIHAVINFLQTVTDDFLVIAYQKGKHKRFYPANGGYSQIELTFQAMQRTRFKTFNDYKDKLQSLTACLQSANRVQAKHFKTLQHLP